jgi:hypothetical protein
MTLEEIKIERGRLSDTIANEIELFEKKTGAIVKNFGVIVYKNNKEVISVGITLKNPFA